MTSSADFQNDIIKQIATTPGWQLAVSSGEIEGAKIVSKFGENPAVGTSEETIWDAGGVYDYLTTASQLDVTSTDADDTDGGNGARTVVLEGLDANYNEITETVTMDGLTIVQTTNSISGS